MQSNHNHNHNYNLMGFDTIEINLVVFPTPQKFFYPLKIYMQRPYIPRCGIFVLKMELWLSPFLLVIRVIRVIIKSLGFFNTLYKVAKAIIQA